MHPQLATKNVLTVMALAMSISPAWSLPRKVKDSTTHKSSSNGKEETQKVERRKEASDFGKYNRKVVEKAIVKQQLWRKDDYLSDFHTLDCCIYVPGRSPIELKIPHSVVQNVATGKSLFPEIKLLPVPTRNIDIGIAVGGSSQGIGSSRREVKKALEKLKDVAEGYREFAISDHYGRFIDSVDHALLALGEPSSEQ